MKKYFIGKFLDHRKLQQLRIKMSGIAPKSGKIMSEEAYSRTEMI